MDDEEMLSKYDRENLLIKLEKEFAYAGATVPSGVEVEGRRIKLRALVFDMAKRRGGLTPEDMAEIDRVTALLRKKRREIVSRISREAMTKAEAKELFDTAMGLDRAIDTLFNAALPKTSVEEEANKAKLEDGRRWLNLAKKVYSGEEKRKRD